MMNDNTSEDDQTVYPATIQSLIGDDSGTRFWNGAENDDLRAALARLEPDDLFEQPVVDRDAARCCLSGLWLLHNFLDDSHEISQSVDSAEGSYWHGIMHRMEGDYGNSKYWFRRAASHPANQLIANRIQREPDEPGNCDSRTEIIVSETWEPERLSDYCGENGVDEIARRFAFFEWQGLFDFCFLKAIQSNQRSGT